MEHLEKDFLPRLNAFSEMLKETHQIQAAHIVNMGNIQKQLKDEIMQLTGLLQSEEKANNLLGKKDLHDKIEEYQAYCRQLEKSLEGFRIIFQQHIKDTNFQLGQFSTMWGGYIEQLAVQYISNLLRKEYSAHTFMHRYKQYWHKSKNVEIDLLALSDTNAYVLEVKNQLKEETFKQMMTILDKIKERLFFVGALPVQPIFVCVHASPRLISTAVMGGIWIVRYRGFDEEDPAHEFEWLRKDIQAV